MGVFLFDLDNTLVNSSPLEAWRRARMWDQVGANLGLIRPYNLNSKIQPHELPAKAREAGHSVGIVTTSPRNYATQVLDLFRIPYDTLVAYQDTTNHKPDPEPLNLALANLGAKADYALYIGDDAVDVEAAYHAGVMSIGAGWGVTNTDEIEYAAPTAMLYHPDAMFPFSSLPYRRYVGELQPGKAMWHDGSVLWVNGGFKDFALGRYFTAGDPRHAKSALSSLIIKHKSSDEPAEKLGTLLAEAIQNVGHGKKFPYVVGVPPKPGKPRDRIGEVLSQLSTIIKKPEYVKNGLTCVKDYGDLKMLGPLDRREAVRNAFKTTWTWNNNNVILVDDVLTTSSTTDECIRVLKANGAAEVALVIFGKDQKAFTRKLCACGRPMKIRTRGSDGAKFWGCSGYPNECTRTENI